MEPLPTIAVHHPTLEGEWMLINEVDFDPAIHSRYQEQSPILELVPLRTELDPALMRQQDLQALYASEGWAAIKAIAQPLGIEKPENGWDAAIPLIVAAEFAGDGR